MNDVNNKNKIEITPANVSDVIRKLQENCAQNAQLLLYLIEFMEKMDSDQKTKSILPIWIPESATVDVQSGSAVAHVRKIEKTDQKPQDTLSKLKSTSIGGFYISYLKKYEIIRRMAYVAWKYCYPIYVNQIASRLQKKNEKRWRQLIPLSEAARISDLPIFEVSAPISVCTPNPVVFPIDEQEYLISPHEEYEFPRLFVAEIRDGVIYGGTNLIMIKEHVICHDLYDFAQDYTSEELHGRQLIDSRRNAIRWLVQDDSLLSISVAASFVDACASNYAHWLTEVLPRVAIFCTLQQFKNVPIVVNSDLHPNIMESLFLIAGTDREIVTLPIGRGMKVQALYSTSVAGYVPFERRDIKLKGHSHGLFSSFAFELIKKRLIPILPIDSEKTWPKRIYLRRNSGIRKVINSVELENALVDKGFVVVSPEKLTFLQQVQLFSRAEVIVGSSGAAMANLIFSSVTAKIYILIGKFPDTSYWYWQNMACASGNNVVYILGQVSNDVDGIHADFFVNIEEIKNI